jgi:hypothetical protein
MGSCRKRTQGHRAKDRPPYLSSVRLAPESKFRTPFPLRDNNHGTWWALHRQWPVHSSIGQTLGHLPQKGQNKTIKQKTFQLFDDKNSIHRVLTRNAKWDSGRLTVSKVSPPAQCVSLQSLAHTTHLQDQHCQSGRGGGGAHLEEQDLTACWLLEKAAPQHSWYLLFWGNWFF